MGLVEGALDGRNDGAAVDGILVVGTTVGAADDGQLVGTTVGAAVDGL